MVLDRDGAPDEFGLSPVVLGVHSERFYGAVGRLICLCSLLEQRLVRLLQLTRRGSQRDFWGYGPAEVVRELRERQPDVAEFHHFLTDVEAIFDLRHHLAHDAWPAQPDGRAYGWRASRQKQSRTGPDPLIADDLTTRLSEDELVGWVPAAVDLIWAANRHIDRIRGDISRSGLTSTPD